MQNYDRLGTVSLDEGITAIRSSTTKKVELLGTLVNVDSLRLKTFAFKGTTCVSCGIKATHFAVERHPCYEYTDHPYHLNLWSTQPDGREILFTHDHTLARSLGGKNKISNTEPMCGPCNWKKSVQERKLLEERNRQSLVNV